MACTIGFSWCGWIGGVAYVLYDRKSIFRRCNILWISDLALWAVATRHIRDACCARRFGRSYVKLYQQFGGGCDARTCEY